MKRLAAVLMIHLALCSPASALRQGQMETPAQRAGLEEALGGLGPKTPAAIFSRIRHFIRQAGEGDPAALEGVLVGFYAFVGAPLPNTTTHEGLERGKQLADDLNLLEQIQIQAADSPEPQPAIQPAAPIDEDATDPGDETTEPKLLGVASIEIYPNLEVDQAEVDQAMRGAGPTLNADEEHSLFLALHARNLDDSKRLELYQFLIQVNMPYILSWLKTHGYTRRFSGPDLDDLIQVGNEGLIRAVVLFDPHRGTRFSTYADYQIKAHIKRFMDQQSKLTRAPQRRITAYRKAMKKLLQQLGREPTPEELATELDWDVAEVAKFRHFRSETSFFRRFEENTDPEAPAPEEASPVFNEELAQLFSVLTNRERILLKMRFGIGTQEGISYILEEIGKRLGYTRERIRQLEKEALEKLRAAALEPRAVKGKQDDHADVYLVEKLGIPPEHPLFQPLLRLGRTDLERIGSLLPSIQSFPIEPAEGESFSDKIRRLRVALGLLPKEVAAGAGVDVRSYRSWENGTSPPRFPHLRSLADYYIQQQFLPAEETYRFLGQKDPRIVLEEIQNQSLPEILCVLRTSCWLNQPEAAQAIGVTPDTYGHWETNSRHPRLFSIRKIAGYYISQHGFPFKSTYERFGIQSPRDLLNGLIGKPLPTVVRELQKSIPISQKELARKIGMHRKDLWGWTSGRRIPKTKNLQKLVGFYAEEQHLPREILLKAFGLKSQVELLEELQDSSLPQTLRKLRGFSGESQEQVADQIGAKRGAYEHWEQGHITRMPTSFRYLLAMHYALQYGFPLQRLIRLFNFRPSSEVMPEITGEDLSHALRILRTSQGLLQTEISGRLGVTRGTYQEWETGRHAPYRANLRKLAAYYSQNHGFPLEALQQQLEAKRRAQQRAAPETDPNPEGQTGGLEEAVIRQQALGSYP